MPARSLRASRLAILLAALVAASTVRFGTFSPWGTDQAGYIESSRRWTAGELVTPVPLNNWPLLSDRPQAASPPAFRPSVRGSADVSVYPLGFPVIMAAMERVLGELAPYLVAPLFAGVLVWCVYTIAARAGGEWAGLGAALLIGMSPVTLGYSVMPMSDVPAAGLWSLAWWLNFRQGYGAAVAAGTVSALAIMVRPHLAPLCTAPLLLLLCDGRYELRFRSWRWRRAFAYLLSALPGPLIVGWSQSLLYGGFATPGYPGAEAFFRVSRVPINVVLLPKHVIAVHTPLIFIGLTAVTTLFGKTADHQRKLVVLSALLVVITFGVYLPYPPYDDVYFVRFMLPGLMALNALNGVQLARLGHSLFRRSKLMSAVASAPIVFMLWFQASAIRYTYAVYKEQSRLILMGHYLREVLPPNAVVFCALQSGAVQHYTHANILRFDLLEPASLESWIERLTRSHLINPARE